MKRNAIQGFLHLAFLTFTTNIFAQAPQAGTYPAGAETARNLMPRRRPHRHQAREFITACVLWLLLPPLAARAAEILTLDVVRATPANPRHDHQLIFPLLDGRLLLVWSEYYVPPATNRAGAKSGAATAGTQRDDMPCRIAAKASADKGRSWGDAFVLQENTGKFNVKHPNLLRLPSGEVLFFYTEWNSMSNRVVFLRRSTDDCKTWSAPRLISAPTGVSNINNDHVLRLRSGRIVLPVFHSPTVWAKDSHWLAFCFYSDDDGRTWQASERKMDMANRGPEEPSIVELKQDGHLLAVLRNSLGSIYQARSMDGGRTWSEPVSTGLRAPLSPSLVKRIPSTGDLLLVWNRNYQPGHHHTGERTPLNSAISRDDGATWEKIKELERTPGGSAAYAAVTFVGDEALVTYYHQLKGMGGASDVRLKIVPVAWFYE